MPDPLQINIQHHERTKEGRNNAKTFYDKFWETAQGHAKEVVAKVDKDGDGRISAAEHATAHPEL